MRKIDLRSLIFAVGIYTFLAIIFSIFNSWVISYTEGMLFGDAGAYSHEDHVAVRDHVFYQTFDYIFEFLKIVIPCSYVAYRCKNGELRNAFAMSSLAALFSSLTTYSWFPFSVPVTVVLFAVLYSVISLPVGLLAKYVKARRLRT
ncbi:hypothetical protein GCM10027217_22960 [Pseudomaricurvus hydrocarbonicus]